MNMLRIILVSGLIYGACYANDQNVTAVQDDQAIAFDFDGISDDDLLKYEETHPITYEVPSWPVLKLQEFASWLIVTYPSLLTIAGKAVSYKNVMDAWWEAHRTELREKYCAQYADDCKQHEPNICQLHQTNVVNVVVKLQALLLDWLKSKNIDIPLKHEVQP